MAAGVLLAAGQSRRMGEANKLLLPVDGRPLVRLCAQTLLEAGLARVVVVLGEQAGRVRRALEDLPLQFVENQRFQEGMGTSLATGIRALSDSFDHAVIALGDMPAIAPDTIRALLRAGGGRGIRVPEHLGRRGHPVVFDLTRYRGELMALEGARGARDILRAHPEEVTRVPVADPGVVLDLDTKEEYEVWLRSK